MTSAPYILAADGIHRPATPVAHRDEEYQQEQFRTLVAMQERHFWYRGRHRFLLSALDRHAPKKEGLRAIDLGGGCGGWLRYLAEHRPAWAQTLALADSSQVALGFAADVLPAGTARYQIDLMNLGWDKEWDAAFLLDVLEHIPDDATALRQVRASLKPGGLLFVTTPALPAFWSYNDDLAKHLRRYTRSDFTRLAAETGFELCDARYFMFLLSPLYWLARKRGGIAQMSEAQKKDLFERSHRVPAAPVNGLLASAFAAETPLGHWMRFPWGTSILGVFRRP